MSLSGLFSAPLFLRDPAVVCSDGEGVGGVAGPVVVVTLPSTVAASTRHFPVQDQLQLNEKKALSECCGFTV